MQWLLHSQGELKEEEAAGLLHAADLPSHPETEQDSPMSLGPWQGAAGSRYALSGTLFPPTLKPHFSPSSSSVVPSHGSSYNRLQTSGGDLKTTGSPVPP